MGYIGSTCVVQSTATRNGRTTGRRTRSSWTTFPITHLNGGLRRKTLLQEEGRRSNQLRRKKRKLRSQLKTQLRHPPKIPPKTPQRKIHQWRMRRKGRRRKKPRKRKKLRKKKNRREKKKKKKKKKK